LAELLGSSWFAKILFLREFLAHPRWLAAVLADGGVPKLQNIRIPGKGPMELIDVSTALARVAVTWEDLRWIRKAWPGPIVVKGILTAEDAKRRLTSERRPWLSPNNGANAFPHDFMIVNNENVYRHLTSPQSMSELGRTFTAVLPPFERNAGSDSRSLRA